MDPKVVESRLVLKESSLVGSGVSKCALKYQALVTSSRKSQSPENDEEKSKVTDSFVREMMAYRLDIIKAGHIYDAHCNQMVSYEQIEHEINQNITAAEANILQLEESYMNEKHIRVHREELESKAKEVNLLPNRATLKRKIDDLEAKLNAVDESLTTVNNRILSRHAQFQSLLGAISDLQSPLVEEMETLPTEEPSKGPGEGDEAEDDYRERGEDGDGDIAVANKPAPEEGEEGEEVEDGAEHAMAVEGDDAGEDEVTLPEES